MKRFTIALEDDVCVQCDYWSKYHGLSKTEFVQEAVIEKIARENKDYDLPTAEIARLNQLIDAVYSLASNQKSMEESMNAGFESILGLTRGDNYLLEEDVSE